MNFGEWVRQEITKHGLTVTWLALEIGASSTLIIKWRTRGSNPKVDSFLKVCKILADLEGVRMCEMMERGAASMGIEIEL